MLKMNLVCESLNEFERGLDPKETMHICLTPKEKVQLKQKVPVLKRKSPYLGTIDHGYKVYSRSYKLWKLLDYIQKGEDAGGRKYSDIVKFYYGSKSGRRSFASGLFNSINRYTIWVKDTKGFRSRPNNRYFLDKYGKKLVEKYKDAFSKKQIDESTTNFTRGLEPKDAMGIGKKYEIYRHNFLDQLNQLQGNDGYPYVGNSYYDYAYETLEEQLYLQEKLRNFMNGGLTPKQTAKLLSKYFEKGQKF